MAAIQFEIESYTATAIRDCLPNANQARYEITLTSKDQGHGIRFTARLIFEDPVGPNEKSYLLNLEGLNYDPRKLVVLLNTGDFSSFYQVLSMENPVYIWFVYKDTVSNDLSTGLPLKSHQIIQFQLKTGSEVPGDFEK